MRSVHVAVVGAGAAGLMAAWAAAEAGARVTLIEKNEKTGKKIYITGKGRCNVTNACDREDFFNNVISNPKFMYKSIYAFDSSRLMSFIEGNGTPLKTERGGRVFPRSDHASDITKALMHAINTDKVKLLLNKRVSDVLVSEKASGRAVSGVRLENGTLIESDSVILACGGATYPASGGCRDGYEIAKKNGIGVTDIRPSLVPFLLKEDYISEMQGLSLKNVTLNIFDNGKRIFSEFGEMLFTHFGISGPLVLTASSLVGDILRSKGTLQGNIDLKPAIPHKELDERLVREISQRGRKNTGSFLEGLLPKSMQPVMVKLWGIDTSKKVCDINGQERKKLLGLLKEFPFTITGTRGFKEAIITKGGVDVKELDPATMQCKKLNGLFICGEMVDVDALTGGYNLQCAFSMGYVAGVNAARVTV